MTVPHGMADDHWIEFIWAKNQDGDFIAGAQLTPADKPELSFALPEGTTAVTGLEFCNQHGASLPSSPLPRGPHFRGFLFVRPLARDSGVTPFHERCSEGNCRGACCHVPLARVRSGSTCPC